MPARRSASSTICRTPAPSCIRIRVSLRRSSSVTVRPANAMPGGQTRTTVSRRNGSYSTPRWRGAAPTTPSSRLAVGDALDDGLRVEDARARRAAADAAPRTGRGACESTTPPGPVDAPISSVPASSPVASSRELVDDLLLEREQPLRAAVEPRARLRRLDATAGAVEELRARAASRAPAPAG